MERVVLKALSVYKKKLNDSLKNNIKHGRTNIAETRQKQIDEVSKLIKEYEFLNVF